MLLWVFSIFSFLTSLKILKPELALFFSSLGFGNKQAELQKVSNVLREIEETLLAGMIPGSDRWALIQNLPIPWGPLASDSLNELRAAGGSLIPTLRRLQGLAEAQSVALSDARARSSGDRHS